MKLFFTGNGTTPVRGCELCLQPMRFLGEHAECRLFRCDDCTLVATEEVDARQSPAEGVSPPTYRM
ncbi:hypothetical protein UP06_20020 [Bradyrhizobium sp. LTSP857]|jgi:hypothetical protein|nr:hypothetical protein UP06_20020 [Bradyrhizobium sp. LTSP857]